MIHRTAEQELRSLAGQFKAVAVVGPRQSGKTTLVRHLFKDKPYANLENPDVRRFALDDPRGFLGQYGSGAILDEVQRTPELFSYLQQVLDESREPGRFILTGSNNFLLQESISQSLAGRVAYLYLMPFSIAEIQPFTDQDLHQWMLKGGYPPLYDQPVDPARWFANYIRTYLERDVRQIRSITNLDAFERVVRLCAGRVGQLLNMSSLAIETGVDSKTIASWIGILESSFILHRLQPHHANFNKRVVKMPKIYFYDTGLACALLGIQTVQQLALHPLYGSLFENMVVGELLKQRYHNGLTSNLFFWRDNTGNEVDVLAEGPDRLYPIEVKSGQTITDGLLRGLLRWQKISGLSGGTLIYAGNLRQERSDGLRIIPWHDISQTSV